MLLEIGDDPELYFGLSVAWYKKHAEEKDMRRSWKT